MVAPRNADGIELAVVESLIAAGIAAVVVAGHKDCFASVASAVKRLAPADFVAGIERFANNRRRTAIAAAEALVGRVVEDNRR